MTLITLKEVVDLFVMTVLLGYIFMTHVRRPDADFMRERQGFSTRDFSFAVLIAAPGIILHELAHKFVALAFGMSATFKAWYFGLFLGVLLKIVNSPLIIFAPGYVELNGGNDLTQAIVAFAGPFLNLVLFAIAFIVLKQKRRFSKNEYYAWYLTKNTNLFLFIFNLLPIPPLDGSKVFAHLFSAIF